MNVCDGTTSNLVFDITWAIKFLNTTAKGELHYPLKSHIERPENLNLNKPTMHRD